MNETEKNNWRIAHSESSMGWGGQEHRVFAELAGFKKRGCAVWLIAFSSSEVATRARGAGITVKPVEFNRWTFARDVLRLAWWLRFKRIEILNTHSSQDGWLLGVAGKIARVPLIIRSRHIDVDYPNRRLSRLAFTTFCDHILTTSEKISGHFEDYFGIPKERISTIPTGIDLERFSPAGSKADFSALGISAQTPVVAMISVLRSWKGHTTFLEAAEMLRARGFAGRFLIVGDGPGRHTIPEEIQRRGLQTTVTMLGHREDVPELLRATAALCIPSLKHEGVPQIGLQALAIKTPVIGSDVGGIPEIIRDGETGRIFPGGNATALAGRILEVLNQSAETRAMAERGRHFVEREHGLEAMHEKIERIYRRCLKR